MLVLGVSEGMVVFFPGPKLFEIVFLKNRFLKLLDVVFSFENDLQLIRVFRKGMKCAVRSGMFDYSCRRLS